MSTSASASVSTDSVSRSAGLISTAAARPFRVTTTLVLVIHPVDDLGQVVAHHFGGLLRHSHDGDASAVTSSGRWRGAFNTLSR
jgi:hypothetical protein